MTDTAKDRLEATEAKAADARAKAALAAKAKADEKAEAEKKARAEKKAAKKAKFRGSVEDRLDRLEAIIFGSIAPEALAPLKGTPEADARDEAVEAEEARKADEAR